VKDRYKEGLFYWDNTDIASNDDTATVVTNGAGIFKKVYKRIFNRIIYPEWWGVLPDPSTIANATGPDAGPGLNAMFRWVERTQRGSYEVDFLNNNYYLGTSVVLPYTIPPLPNDGNPYLKINGPGVTIRTNVSIGYVLQNARH